MTAFARKTGDIAVLSTTDLSVIALTYQHEVAENGEGNIRTELGSRHQPNTTVPNSTATPAGASDAVGEFEEPERGDEEVEEENSSSEGEVDEVEEITRSIDQVLLDPLAGSEDLPQQSAHESSNTPSTSQRVSEQVSTPDTNDAAVPDEDDESDGGEWITPSNVNQHRSHDLGLLPTENANAESGPIAAACMTGDFAVQNVLLGMGLGLVGEGGKRISKVKSFVLRCHACFK